MWSSLSCWSISCLTYLDWTHWYFWVSPKSKVWAWNNVQKVHFRHIQLIPKLGLERWEIFQWLSEGIGQGCWGGNGLGCSEGWTSRHFTVRWKLESVGWAPLWGLFSTLVKILLPKLQQVWQRAEGLSLVAPLSSPSSFKWCPWEQRVAITPWCVAWRRCFPRCA